MAHAAIPVIYEAANPHCADCHADDGADGGCPAVDGFAGMHGLKAGADRRSGEPRCRFQSCSPDDFTEDGRTSPPNYSRGVPGQC